MNEFFRSPAPRLRILVANIASMDARLQAILAGDALSFARSSDEARKRLEFAPFDLAVVCLRFNGSRMFDLLGHIRATPRLGRLPVASVDFDTLPAGDAGNDGIRRRLYGCIDKGTRMARSSTYTRTLQHASDTVGGHQALARALGVDPAELSRWIRGVDFPPFTVFLAALDIIANGPYGAPSAGMRVGRAGESAG